MPRGAGRAYARAACAHALSTSLVHARLLASFYFVIVFSDYDQSIMTCHDHMIRGGGSWANFHGGGRTCAEAGTGGGRAAISQGTTDFAVAGAGGGAGDYCGGTCTLVHTLSNS